MPSPHIKLAACAAVTLLAAVVATRVDAATTFAVEGSLPCTSGCVGNIGVTGTLTLQGTSPYPLTDISDFELTFFDPAGETLVVDKNNGIVGGTATATLVQTGKVLSVSIQSKSDVFSIIGVDPATSFGAGWQFNEPLGSEIIYFVGTGPGQSAIAPILTPPFQIQIGVQTATPGPVVPIPAALPLLATGLAGLGVLGWRRRGWTPAADCRQSGPG